MSLSSRSIRRPVAVAMLFVAVLFLGLISFGRLPIDLLPEVAYPRLVVYTRYAGVGPAEIERYITEPIEQQVATVPGLQRIESASREGVSLVTLRFAWGSDMDFAALNVREKLDNLRESLPALAERPVVLRTDPGSDPIMAISVAGGGSLWSLKDLAESVLRRRLEQIEGVAQAAVTGGLEREIQVEVDASRLEAHGLVIGDVAGALDAANAPSAGGTVRRGDFRYALRTLGELESVEQIGEILVRPAPASGADSASLGVRLADVATITDGFRERESIARYNGREAVGLLIFKEAGANTVRVAEAVGDVLVELREEFPDIAVSVAMSQARFVSEAIDNVVAALLQGAALAFLVLFLFLRDWRYPVGIALAIPISVVATFALLDAAGISLNVMTLGGLALGVGMLVDNSIVVLENVFRHRELGSPAPVAAALGAEEVQGAITASTLTTIAVFGPIVYVEGVAGELFGALSLAVAFSLLASLVVALMLLPTLAARWQGAARGVRGVWGGGGRGGTAREARFIDRPLAAFDRAFARFSAFYERALHAALRHRARTLGAAAGLFVLALAVGSTLDRDVLPTVDQGELTLRLTLPRGAPLERTAQAAASLERLLLDDDAVEAVFTRVGRQAAIAGVTDEESGLHTGVLDVQLVDGAATADVVRRIRPRLAGLGVGTVAIETGTATALGRLLGGGEADLAVRVQGEDLDAALAYAGSVERRLEGVSAVTNVRLGTELGQPEVQIEIDRERAASYGIPPIEVARTIESYMQGQVATQFVDFDRRVPVVVRLPDATRHSLLALEQLRVRGVPLRELVVLRDAVGPTEIRRVDQTRQVAVYADVASGGVARATEAIESALREAPAPRGLRVEIGGENEEMRRGFRHLAFAFLLALLLVFMILAAEFESIVLPFVVLLSVPLGVVGAAFALWLVGAGINTMSLIGIIILAGIVDNDAVVKIDFINQLRRKGMGLRDAVVAGGRARLRPILMTTATTLLGVLPMALGLGRGAELQRPLAIAVFGGLFTATALTLLVIPVVYEIAVEAQTRAKTVIDRRGRPAPEATPPPPAAEPALAGTSALARTTGER